MDTKKIDVLAVMRRMHLQANACRSGGAGSGTQDFEDESAITAVAELIEAAKELRQRQRDYLSQPKGERIESKGRLVGIAAERLDAALANIGPQP